jgi:hypothetical protein
MVCNWRCTVWLDNADQIEVAASIMSSSTAMPKILMLIERKSLAIANIATSCTALQADIPHAES